MAAIELPELRKRHLKAIAEAPNKVEILDAIARLQARQLPFTAYDFGNRVTVTDLLGAGLVRFVFPEGRGQGERTSFASRLRTTSDPNSKALVPAIELPVLEPILEVGHGHGQAVALYVFKGSDGHVRWLLHVPKEIDAKFPGADLTLALQGCGSSWSFGREIAERTRQTAYRCMQKISDKFGGAKVVLRFQPPPQSVLDEGER